MRAAGENIKSGGKRFDVHKDPLDLQDGCRATYAGLKDDWEMQKYGPGKGIKKDSFPNLDTLSTLFPLITQPRGQLSSLLGQFTSCSDVQLIIGECGDPAWWRKDRIIRVHWSSKSTGFRWSAPCLCALTRPAKPTTTWSGIAWMTGSQAQG